MKAYVNVYGPCYTDVRNVQDRLPEFVALGVSTRDATDTLMERFKRSSDGAKEIARCVS